MEDIFHQKLGRTYQHGVPRNREPQSRARVPYTASLQKQPEPGVRGMYVYASCVHHPYVRWRPNVHVLSNPGLNQGTRPDITNAYPELSKFVQ
jgi:hypothetical protein